MSEPILGEIRMVGFNWAPVGWALCDGQLLPIAQNNALFSLLGTTYGGDGKTTFGLPDLRGRVAIHQGKGPGLSNRIIAQKGGAESVALNSSTMPTHGHTAVGKIQATTDDAEDTNPGGNVLATLPRGDSSIYGAPKNLTDMASTSVSVTVNDNTGGGQPHENMQPFQVVNFIIATNGSYPQRP